MTAENKNQQAAGTTNGVPRPIAKETKQATKLFKVLSPLLYNDTRYEIGSVVGLPAEVAAGLGKDVIEEVESAE